MLPGFGVFYVKCPLLDVTITAAAVAAAIILIRKVKRA
jgi:hypothetical protein